ncbi:MAG: pyridoxamine 5'-phosphate oxidase family protein [Myxococcota bacterium]|jgi:hypothetical protein|nr:pyridoxamine 5'-phosphate oxidase family protein [Myxococcota bacterium]
MSEFFDSLSQKHIDFILGQPVFFVSTAAGEGKINLSPKGLDTFRVLSPTQTAYLDLGGSGNETHAHLEADGRITLMFCNFDNPALILRLYGRGVPVLPLDSAWAELSTHFEILPGTRQIFDIAIESIQTSCGWGVPLMRLEKERATLTDYHAKADKDVWVEKVSSRTQSLDGLPVRATDRYFGPENQ